MMHRAWSSIVEVPYCFSRSSVKFHGHTALKIVEFDPNWAFPDSNSSLNSPMAMKCCTKLETAKERCPIIFQGHPSNFKVTRDKTSPNLTQIGRFRTIGRSQLSNPSDLPCCNMPRILIRWSASNSPRAVHPSLRLPCLWEQPKSATDIELITAALVQCAYPRTTWASAAQENSRPSESWTWLGTKDVALKICSSYSELK